MYKVPDFVSFAGQSGLDIGPFSEQGTLNLLLDPASKRFAGALTGGVTFEGVKIPSYAVALSNDGFGVCLGPPYMLLPTQVTYHWGDAAPQVAVSLDGCPGVTAFAPAAGAARAPRAHAAAGTTFTVAAGTKVIDLAVTSPGGAPSLVLTNPSGAQIVPSVGASRTATNAAAFPVAASATTYVGVVNPAPGVWTVSPAAGSPPIAGVSFAHPLPPTTVSVKLSGRGATHRVTYLIKGPPSATVRLAESGPSLDRVFATLRPGRGTLPFRPAARTARPPQHPRAAVDQTTFRGRRHRSHLHGAGTAAAGSGHEAARGGRGAAFHVTWRPGRRRHAARHRRRQRRAARESSCLPPRTRR